MLGLKPLSWKQQLLLEPIEIRCQVGLTAGGLCHGADGLYTYRRSSLATALVQQLPPGSFMEQAWWQSWRRVPAPVRGNCVLQKGAEDPAGNVHENQGRDGGDEMGRHSVGCRGNGNLC